LDVLRAITHGERHAVPWLETKAVCQCPGELCHPIAQGSIGEAGLCPKRHGRPFSKRPGRFREEAGDVHSTSYSSASRHANTSSNAWASCKSAVSKPGERPTTARASLIYGGSPLVHQRQRP